MSGMCGNICECEVIGKFEGPTWVSCFCKKYIQMLGAPKGGLEFL
jgi:hypothetical protein